MSLRLPHEPTQASGLQLTPYFYEADSVVALKLLIAQAVIDLDIPNLIDTSPQGWKFISDIQYQTASSPGGVNYSVMIIVGEWGVT